MALINHWAIRLLCKHREATKQTHWDRFNDPFFPPHHLFICIYIYIYHLISINQNCGWISTFWITVRTDALYPTWLGICRLSCYRMLSPICWGDSIRKTYNSSHNIALFSCSYPQRYVSLYKWYVMILRVVAKSCTRDGLLLIRLQSQCFSKFPTPTGAGSYSTIPSGVIIHGWKMDRLSVIFLFQPPFLYKAIFHRQPCLMFDDTRVGMLVNFWSFSSPNHSYIHLYSHISHSVFPWILPHSTAWLHNDNMTPDPGSQTVPGALRLAPRHNFNGHRPSHALIRPGHRSEVIASNPNHPVL